jgi:tRNA modification GTPase
MLNADTIIAPASALGGGVAVVRVSGPRAGLVLTAFTQSPLPKPRLAQLKKLLNPQNPTQIIDHALCLYFAGPHSFTGEDVVELQVHGGRAVVQQILDAACALPNVRLAQNGEFSKRAVLNGKLDLTAAEAVADLVAAETQSQAELALQQYGGALAELYEGWRKALLKHLAYLEASIDFADEGDIDTDLAASVWPQLQQLCQNFAQHLQHSVRGERLREGVRVVLIGAPNAGKSTLLNALSLREAAIVSTHAGTTRDALEVPLNMGGYPIILVDTAGLRHTVDEVEAMGIARTAQHAASADILLLLQPSDEAQISEHIQPYMADSRALMIYTKSDVVPAHDNSRVVPAQAGISNSNALAISAHTGQNLQILIDAIIAQVKSFYDAPRQTPVLTRARHRHAVELAVSHLQRALIAPSLDMAAEDVRLAMRAIGSLTGFVDVEDLLDVIFKDFCLGK